MINIIEKLNNYSKEDLINLIKIFINNNNIDFINVINLYENNFETNMKLKKYEEEDNYVELMIDNGSDVVYKKFSKEEAIIPDVILNYESVKYSFFQKTKLKVLINKEIDFYKKDIFVKNNILYVSNDINDIKKIKLIIYQYINYIVNRAIIVNDISVQEMLKLMINYRVFKEEMVIPDIIEKSDFSSKFMTFMVSFYLYNNIIETFKI